MKVNKQDIRPGLRARGRALKILLPYFTERKFRMSNRFLDCFLKGRWLGRTSRMREYYIPRPDGTALRVCVCRARKGGGTAATGLLWMHGGGFAIGLPEQDSAFIDCFTEDGSCVVVSPDYRRSTERPYPAALKDCYRALLWMKANAKKLGIRTDQLFVGGDSAGGGLTAALCLYARDRGEVAVAFQMPLYPMLDDRMISDSAVENDAPVWNSQSNENAWRLYLGARFGRPDTSAYAAPARAADLPGLPPACTYVGTVEPFHDETVAYVTKLRRQGIPVFFKEFAGCYHGFDIVCPGSGAAKEAKRFLMRSFRYAQKHYYCPQPESNLQIQPQSKWRAE